MGVAPVVASAVKLTGPVISFISSLFGKKPWSYRLVAFVNRQRMAGFFTVYAYLGKTDRIKYWFDLITTTKGIGIDSGPNYGHQLQLECVKAAVDAKRSLWADYPSFTPGSVAQALFEKGLNNPIADDGSWSVPKDLVPSTTDTSTQAQQPSVQQASMFSGILPIVLIGGALFLIGPKLIKMVRR